MVFICGVFPTMSVVILIYNLLFVDILIVNLENFANSHCLSIILSLIYLFNV